jgi:hypothetical protein
MNQIETADALSIGTRHSGKKVAEGLILQDLKTSILRHR